MKTVQDPAPPVKGLPEACPKKEVKTKEKEKIKLLWYVHQTTVYMFSLFYCHY